MKNFWGQEIAIGSTVGVGYRRTGSKWRQLGTVVKLTEKKLAWPRNGQETFWQATVVWVSEERGERSWYDGPTFMSPWDVRDLLVVDEKTLDPNLVEAIDNAYADYMFRHEPSDFVPNPVA